MSLNFSLKGEKLILIIHDLDCKITRFSPSFTILDIYWRFQHDLRFGKHLVRLHKLSQGIPEQPFDITISVENDKVKDIKSAFNQRIRVSEFDKPTDICRWDEDSMKNILRKRDGFEKEVLKLTLKFDFSIIPKVVRHIKGEIQKLGDSCVDSLSEDLKVLLTDNAFSDVELKCEDGSVKAHRNILSARSKVFSALLQNDMKEKRSGVVNIEDFDADVLKKFLHYIYTGTLPDLTMDVAYRLYDAGEKYAVLGLKGRCAVYLAENVSEDNVCDLLVTADFYSDEEFKEKVIAYILEKNIPSKKDVWRNFCKSHSNLACEVLTKAYERQNK